MPGSRHVWRVHNVTAKREECGKSVARKRCNEEINGKRPALGFKTGLNGLATRTRFLRRKNLRARKHAKMAIEVRARKSPAHAR